MGKKFKLVAHVHGSDIQYKNKLKKKMLCFLLNQCDVVVVPSKEYANKIKNEFDMKNTYISPSGGVPDYFFLSSMNNFNNRRDIGFVGRFEPVKRPLKFINIIEYLVNKKLLINSNVYMIGEGVLSGIVKKKSQGISHFHINDFVDRTDLPMLLDKFRILFLTSERESLCLVALEAMSRGVVVVSHDCGGVNDFIINNQNGFIIDMDSNDYLLVIADILKLKSANLEVISKNARKTAEKYKSSIVNDNFILEVFN